MNIIVAHSGPRDAYQVALALSEAGRLDGLVTDLYWPHDWSAARLVEALVRDRGAATLRFRSNPGLPSKYVSCCAFSGCSALAMRKLGAPFSWKRAAIRWNDAQIGRRAGRRAAERGAALLSYSYYAYHAFSAAPADTPKILFQLHPHPLSVRDILSRELVLRPNCAASLLQEWELALPEHDFKNLVEETRMAQHWIVASSFSRRTLIEHGAPGKRIHVAPYGIDLARFAAPDRGHDTGSRRLRLLFVGTINQRKGIGYLLEALELLEPHCVELIVCGRVVDDLRIFQRHSEHVEIRASVSDDVLRKAYRSADLFVLPSLAEGFAHVLLEAMASGVPVLSTTSTAAPDLIEHGVEGFVVEPGRADLLAAPISWAVDHRRELTEMGRAARRKAETFTWARFRGRIAAIMQEVLPDTSYRRERPAGLSPSLVQSDTSRHLTTICASDLRTELSNGAGNERSAHN
jgi:glycosyltransferase involved in cell wall biosynthesis